MPFLRADGLPLFPPADYQEEWECWKRAARKSKVQPSHVYRSKPEPKVTPGDRYETASYRKSISRACQRAGVKTWSPNSLRKLAVAHTLEIDVARALLGHSDTGIIRRHYARHDLQQAMAGARALQTKAISKCAA